MVTFEFSFLGYEDRILDAAISVAPAFNMTIGDAVALVHEAIDVDQHVVLQVSDTAFARLIAMLDMMAAEDEGLDFEITVHAIEPDLRVYSINTCPRLPSRMNGVGFETAPREWDWFIDG